MQVNLVYWNSLHPKIAILPTFSGQNPHFLSEKQKTRSNNLHLRKADSVAVFLSLREGVQYIQKVVEYFYNVVAVKCTLYLARPPTPFYVTLTREGLNI